MLQVLNGGPFHGFAIAERIHALSRDVLIVEEGSLYPQLYRMEERGWIEPEWGQSRTKAVGEYLKAARHGNEQGGALLRPLRNRTSSAGTEAALSADSLWRIVMGYAEVVEIDVAGFGPHSSITITRLYDKRVVMVKNSPTLRVSY